MNQSNHDDYFDLRTLDRKLRQQEITQEEYQRWLSELPDTPQEDYVECETRFVLQSESEEG